MTTPRLARFGVFEMDLRTGELRKKGLTVKLQGQPFQVLAMLVDRAGDLVTRDELRQRLWPDDVFVDFEHSLNKCVVKVRRALGDLADSPRYVETLERRGYRFIAPVEFAEGSAAARPAPGRIVYASRSIPLHEGVNVVGRDPDAVVFIDSSKVSRRHALVTITATGATLSDLGSKNGTFVNDLPVRAPVALSDGDEIVVGDTHLVFRVAPTTDRTKTLSHT